MSAEEIVKIYQEIIANPDKLKQGKEILENLISTVPQFATLTCKIITSNEIPALFRKNVCYIIKNVLKDTWMVSPALNNERKEIKEILLTGMVTNMNDFKIIEALSLIIAEVIKQEGVEGWQPYLNELIKWINTNEVARITAGVECLCLIFKQTDDRMRLIVPDLMPVLYQIFNLPELPERAREKILMLVYLCIITFSWAEGANDDLIHECFDSTFEQWLTIFIKVLETPAKEHISMKKYILKILTKIFSELKKYSMKAVVSVIQPVWKFMNSTLPLFIWSVVYGVPVEDIQDGMKTVPQSSQTKKQKETKNYANEGFELDEDPDLFNEIEAMAVQLIQLMQTLLSKKKIKSFVQAGLFPLINCLCYYMLFSKYQEKTWFEDPNEFQAEEEDTVNMVSLRREILQVLESLIDRFSNTATQTIMVIAEKFLSNMKEEDSYGYLKEMFDRLGDKSQVDLDTIVAMVKTSHFEGEHPDHVWKKRELGLLLMGSFADSIVEYLSSTGSDTNVLTLIEKLVGDFENESNAILKGRSLWCITQFSELVGGQGLKPLLTLFKLSARCLGDSHLPVRLTAAKAVRIFAYKIEQDFLSELNEQVKGEYHLNDVQIVNQLFELLEKCSEDTLHIILEGLVVFARVSPQHIPRIAEILCSKVIELFQLVHNDILNGPVLKDLIKICSKHENAVPHIVNVFLPYISEIFQFKLNNGGSIATHINLGSSTEENFFASLFDILRLLVESNVNKQHEPIVALLPFLLKFMNECTDYDMLSHASICLKAYVANYSQYILEKNYQQDVIAIIYKLLRSDVEELSCTYIGNLIIITFANLLNNSLDTDMLKEVINKLAKAEISSTIQSLVIVYARLINISEKEVLDFLCSFRVGDTIALKVLLDKWLFHQPVFQGKNAKTLTLLGLTRLFLAKDSRVENLKVVGYDKNSTEETYAPFRIMSVLVKALDSEIQSQQNIKNTGNKISQLMKEYAAGGSDDEDGEDGFEDVDEDGNFYGGDDQDDPEGEEAVKITEDDLANLKDISSTLVTLEMLKEFFLAVAKKDHEYFSFCFKNMPDDYAQIVQRYMQF